MTTCQRETSISYLADHLSDVEVTRYVEHLDGCQQCREWLEEAAGGRGERDQARALLSSSSEQMCWRPANADVSQPAQDLLRNVDLSFLAPCDDPAYAGRINGYLISGLIGRGGMGIVLKAVDSTLNRNVAIKVLDPSLADLGAARQRFAREARAMAAISHEHVIPIYAVDEHQRLPYFAMEYVAGGTLEARLKQQGPLATVSIVRIALQVARALKAAHDSGLVHRDIKPGNILLDQGTDRVRVADFGLARVANDASCTRSGIVAGTPQFMSPEQVRGEDCDGRSDLFSLGSVMYSMATGHPPFRSETIYGAMHRIVHDQARPVRSANGEIPEWLNAFILKLLEKNRDQRFESAAVVVDLLEAELAALQNPAHAQTPARRWMSRSWSQPVRMAIAALACAGISFAAWNTWPMLNSQPQEQPQVQQASGHVISPVESPAEQPPATEDVPPPALWNVDGFNEVRARAMKLRERWEREDVPVTPPTIEDEDADLKALHQRLNEVEASLSVER